MAHRMMALLLAVFYAGIAVAKPTLLEQPPSHEGAIYLQVAQSNATTLTDSDLRRLNYYSERSLTQLKLLERDQQDTNVDALRNAIHRLIDAAERSGLNQEQAADYFLTYAFQQSVDVPAFLSSNDARLETQQLFQRVSAFYQTDGTLSTNITGVNDVDLTGLQNITIAPLGPSVVQFATPEIPAIPAIQVQRPEVPDSANPVNRAIYERIEIRGDIWVIEVTLGDSLSQFANALYGDRTLFGLIYAANIDILTSANILEVGQVLTLPHNR